VVSSFRLFAGDNGLALAGSVDRSSSDRLGRVLAATAVSDDVVVLDLAGLEFLDLGACRALAHWVAGLADRSVTVQVTGSSALLRQMWRVLDLDQLAPLTFLEMPA
jgi:ABC-type transporter Mla MlaB component